MEQLIAIGIVFGLLGALVYFVKRRTIGPLLPMGNKNSPSKRMRYLERLVLDPQHVVHMIEADGVCLLMTTYQGGVHVERLHKGFSETMADELHSLPAKS